ncbi:MAG: exodeoxyribonuclease VII small subunit [Pseudomonadota bacterium]
MSRKNDLTFEEGLSRLEELIQELEDGKLDLDRSLAVFEEGIKLSRVLGQKLDQAEKKLELLLKDEQGQPIIEEFNLGPEEE